MPVVKHELKFFVDKKAMDFPRLVGIELEVAYFNRAKDNDLVEWANNWSASIGTDNSIRPPKVKKPKECYKCQARVRGALGHTCDEHPNECRCNYHINFGTFTLPGGDNMFEIRTSPAKGKYFIEQINEMCAILKNGNAQVNKTCGLHVHVDARDLKLKELSNVVQYWPMLQKELYKKPFKIRRANRYCKRRRGDKRLIEALNKAPDGRSITTVGSYAGSHLKDRYASLNLQALLKYHTLENRMHQAVLEGDRIIKWAKFNSNFVEEVKNCSQKELTEPILADKLLKELM